MNIVGGSSSRCRPFKKEKKNKKKMQSARAPKPSQTKKLKSDQNQMECSTARSKNTGREIVLSILPPWIQTGREKTKLLWDKVII